MSETDVQTIRDLLQRCSAEEREAIFRELRKHHIIHEFETLMGASAEMILEAVHRAPELTRRMLRGVIADAAFRTEMIPQLADQGWADDTPEGNFAFDYRLRDGIGPITIQVKLQRSERGVARVDPGQPYGMGDQVYIVETQKTRTGTAGDEQTRPYRYGEFDVLAVSMQPSTKRWDRFKFTLGRWLIPKDGSDTEIATLQPVAMDTDPGGFWTEDFGQVAAWFRSPSDGKRMAKSASPRRRAPKPGK